MHHFHMHRIELRQHDTYAIIEQLRFEQICLIAPEICYMLQALPLKRNVMTFFNCIVSTTRTIATSQHEAELICTVQRKVIGN